jgi:hypothetical protein
LPDIALNKIHTLSDETNFNHPKSLSTLFPVCFSCNKKDKNKDRQQNHLPASLIIDQVRYFENSPLSPRQ